MYKYKDDICVIPDEIKRMSEEELKTEIARIKQNSTPKKALSPLHYRIILNKHFSCCRYPLQQDFMTVQYKKSPVRHPNLDIVLRGFVVLIAMPPSFR